MRKTKKTDTLAVCGILIPPFLFIVSIFVQAAFGGDYWDVLRWILLAILYISVHMID